MAEIKVAILGLGRLGASIGLGLKRYNARQGAKHHFRLTGFATGKGAADTAQKLKAVDDLARNAGDAVRGRDIIVMAMPYAEVEATYNYIARDVRAGAVILDFSPYKAPSLAWAAKYLSSEVHVIGVTALVNPKYLFDGIDETERAGDDLFDQGMLLLSPSVNCIPDAIELGEDFAALLGAGAQFVDPAENDPLAAAAEGLPALLALAYFHTLNRSQGWRDLERLTNPAFATITRPLYDTHPDDLRDLLLTNREALQRYLDELMVSLRQMRTLLAENNQHGVEALLASTEKAYDEWFERRSKLNWGKEDSVPSTPNFTSNLFGGFIGNRMSRNNNDSK